MLFIVFIISSILTVSHSENTYNLKIVSTRASDVGEGPHWDELQQVLWYVDLRGCTVCRLNTTSAEDECIKFSDVLTVVIPFTNERDVLITQRNKALRLNWKTKRTQFIAEAAPQRNGKEVFNDGKADAKGRLWMGTFLEGPDIAVKGEGNVYKLVKNKFIKEADDYYLTNGMTWSLNNKKMYIVDYSARVIFKYDFNLKRGTLSNRKTLVNLANNADFTDADHPDGLTIDHSGCLWCASYGGGRIFKINPKTGKVEASISLPCPLVTSLAFGGINFDELFVTTAYKDRGPDLRPIYPNCGKVFRITTSDSNFRGDVMNRIVG